MPRNRCWLTLPGHTHNCRTKSKFLSLWSAERLIKPRKELTKTKLPFYRHVSERNTFHDCGLKQFFFHGGDGRDLHKRAQYSLLPLAFPTSGQRRTPEEQLVGNPCPEGCASQAHRCWQLTLSTLRTLLPLSEILCPAASPWPFPSKQHRLPRASLEKWFSQATQHSSDCVNPPGSKLFLSFINLFLVFQWPSLPPNKNTDNLQHIYP